ncbi:glycosyltransferase [Agromyces sp. SYSU T0242]|uniref:glycosyltransferase n=1 Tax=Agromyces litoreus TaxID=3158561 RepID=UPI00339681A8
MGVHTALQAVERAPGIVEAMHAADDLAAEARRDPGTRLIRLLERTTRGADDLTAIAAAHALAGALDEDAGRLLSGLLSDERAVLREHAAWVLGSGLPRLDAVGRLLGMVVAGGFGGMIAQRTLEEWSSVAPEAIATGIEGALLGVDDPSARTRLVETLGLVGAPLATGPLLRVARDADEPEGARVAAVAALGHRTGDGRVPALLEQLARGDGPLAEAARLAAFDLDALAGPTPPHGDGLTVAQLFLHADIDPSLQSAGAGDTGGIATLLVRLGDALAAEPAIGRVLTLSRGSVGEATADLLALATGAGPGHDYGRVPLLADPVPASSAWPMRVAARRGIRRLMRAAGGVDVLHLRMADVGTLAAAEVARESGVPVVFTLAPDPHGVIESLERSGRLTRAGFGRADLAEHFWFRARLVERLAATAAHTVLFPRPDLREDLRRLVRVDLDRQPERHTIVPEGVDLGTVDRAVADAEAHAAGAEPGPELRDLRSLLETLPAERRGRPLVVSLGRLHPVKGMATLVEAWIAGGLADRVNLLVVGGDLAAPSRDERDQLDRIDALVPERERAGLLMAGHRPNGVALRWLAAVRAGVPDLAAPRGVYACASVKEEFGLALLEAMAVGLYVVAPDSGGPPTYVEHGVTGSLVATSDVQRLADALSGALDAAGGDRGDERAEAARATVRERFAIQAMSGRLGDVYRDVAREEAALLEPAERVG